MAQGPPVSQSISSRRRKHEFLLLGSSHSSKTFALKSNGTSNGYLTPWSMKLLEKLLVAQLLRNLPSFMKSEKSSCVRQSAATLLVDRTGQKAVSTLVRFWLLAAAGMKMSVFWDVAPCGVVKVDWRFRGAYCLHSLHGTTFHTTAIFVVEMRQVRRWSLLTTKKKREPNYLTTAQQFPFSDTVEHRLVAWLYGITAHTWHVSGSFICS
jgi:hypothetical protein